MAEKHDVRELLDITRKKIRIFQEIMQDLNKSNKDWVN
jgi:cell division septum initiation protein DivIVA